MRLGCIMRGGYMSVEVLPLVGWVYYGGTIKKGAVNSYKIAIMVERQDRHCREFVVSLS